MCVFRVCLCDYTYIDLLAHKGAGDNDFNINVGVIRCYTTGVHMAVRQRPILVADYEQEQKEAQASWAPTANRSVSVAKCLHIP